ncbi:MAG: hypothetical protein JW884_01050 [Deltaproteobacteria bacterium]|nr:hypothetical protein [Deltaproteobacteria bacterium]
MEDLTGRRFDRLLVVGYMGHDRHGHDRWLCHCDCGNRRYITIGSRLKGGQSKRIGCGCLITEDRFPRIDITGRRFGRLVAVRYERGKWICRCDCGALTTAMVTSLRKGLKKSCGCLIHDSGQKKMSDLAGLRFDRLTALRRVNNPRDRNVKWLCACDCGNETIVYGFELRRGRVKSCGCLRAEKNRRYS